MSKRFWVYIVTDKAFGTLYIGLTSDLFRRIHEHREGIYKGFSKRYGLRILAYYEEHPTFESAVEREKELKKWRRYWKIDLIKAFNTDWRDLYESLNQ